MQPLSHLRPCPDACSPPWTGKLTAEGEARGLRPGETAILRKYFKDSLAYEAVRVYRRRYAPIQGKGTAMAPNGHVYFPADAFCEDFSAEVIGLRAWFIHEMTHVWQTQNGVFRDLRLIGAAAMIRGLYLRRGRSGRPGRFLYELPARARPEFGELGFEQQASMVEAYYLAVHGATLPPPEWFDDEETGVMRHFLAAPDQYRGKLSRRLHLA